MKILAFEFSSVQRSVAVFRAGGHSSQAGFEALESGGQATKALALVEQALAEAGLHRRQIERVVVGLGPGSYTGIRAAIALAQGWQLARGVELVGISSADSLAAEAQDRGLRGKVAVIIDAQRGEFYAGVYDLTETCQVVEPLKLASRAEVDVLQQAGVELIGPEVTKWFPEGRQLFPRALRLCQLALQSKETVAGEKLEPIYLRETSFVKAPKPRIVPPL